MASTSVNPQLARGLTAPGIPAVRGLVGKVNVALLRLAARYDERPLVRVACGVVGLIAAVVLWSLVALAHELGLLLVAAALPIVTAFEPIQSLLEVLPINYIYAAATIRYAGEIQPAGLAIMGDLGVAAAERWPGLFFDPSYVAGDSVLSAVIAPGSSIMARTLASGLVNLALLAVGVAICARAVRNTQAGALVGLGLPRLSLLVVGLVVQLEVAARVLRAAGSIRDLETLGVLPFVFHELLRLHREQYDLVVFQLSRLLDPVFSEVVLASLYALIAVGCLALVGVRRVVRGGLPTRDELIDFVQALRPARLAATARVRLASIRFARPVLPISAPPGPRPLQLTVEASLVVVLLAALPLGNLLHLQTRFLELDNGDLLANDLATPTFVELTVPPVSLDEPPVLLSVAPQIASTVPIPQLAPVLGVSAAVAALPPAIIGTLISPAEQAAPPVAIAPPVVRSVVVAPPVLPPIVRPSVVSIGGRGYRFTYVVNGEVAEFRGMGYNVTHFGLPPAERAERLRRDFALMREVGVNTIVGWRTSEWDEALLDAAQAAGIGVVMPYDLDDKLDYSDRSVRFRVRSDVMAWVARFRNHPAVRMWGLGNETLLHVKQAARSRAFAEFYSEMVDRVRQFDPDHPILYREAEDLYLQSLREVWATRGGPPHGFVVGMNFYTFRMRDAIEGWPKRGMDVPVVISEFAPAGLGRGERAAGYWRMWAMIRGRPEYVLGAAPYVWNVEGPEPVDRLFGLTDGAGKAVDSALGTLKDMYSLPLPTDGGPDVNVPGLLGLRLPEARRAIEARGLKLTVVTYQRADQLRDPTPARFYGLGNVMHQEPDPGARVQRGGEVRIAISEPPPPLDYPIGRPRPD